MHSREIYENLLLQYQKLNLEEKNAILIYKSTLYVIINLMTSIPNYLELDEQEILEQLPKELILHTFSEFKKVVMLPKNYVIKRCVFGSIQFQDIYTCLQSLKGTCQILKQAKGKLTLPESITVYRGVSIDDNHLTSNLSIGAFLSTGLQIEDISSFLFQKANNHIFIITIEKGASVLATPYSLISTYDRNQNHLECLLKHMPMTTLKVVHRHPDCQEELIFFPDELCFQEISTRTSSIQDEEIRYPATIHQIDATLSSKKEKVYQYAKNKEN